MKTTNSLWKFLFLILLAMNLALIGVVAYRVIQPREEKISQTTSTTGKSDVKVGSFVTTREALNKHKEEYHNPISDRCLGTKLD